MPLTTQARRPPSPGRTLGRTLSRAGVAYALGASVFVASVFVAACTPAQPRPQSPRQQLGDVRPDGARLGDARLGDAEFWDLFTTMSEPGGSFPSENFVSNEMSYQYVIPELQRSLTRDGVYLGVGPEQNFTYIANLRPRLAIIFDIRRQNAMQHLMYKALFEMSSTRAEFVARLFSRPTVARQAADIAVKALFDSAAAAPASDSAYTANLAAVVDLLTVRHGFALLPDDIATIEHVYKVFFTAGPEVNYGYRAGNPAYMRSTYPSYGMLQVATNADGVEMAFLASESNYHTVRGLQLRNLVVPVVGDFGGPSAVRAVGKWLTDRAMTATAFYVSNVEQYLWRDPGAAGRFYGNLAAVPLDSTSMFIRSVPRMGMPTMNFSSGGAVSAMRHFSVTRDVNGYLITTSTRDSAGIQVTKTTIDSSRVRRDSSATQDTALISMLREMRARVDSLSRLNSAWQVAGGPVSAVVIGGSLTSGLASIQTTLRAHFAGELKTYNSIIDMTKVSGWKQ
jgi:hypothetical protein